MDKAGNCLYRRDFANIANPPGQAQPAALTLPLPRLPPPRDTARRGPWPAPGEDSGDRMVLAARGWDLRQHRPALPITVASGHSHSTLGCCGVPPTPGTQRMRCGCARGVPASPSCWW